MSSNPSASVPEPYRSLHPKFEAHAHVCGDKTAAIRVMDAVNIRAVLNISYGGFQEANAILDYEESLRDDTARFPERFWYCASFNVTRYADLGHAEQMVRKLRRDLDEHGAVAVKIWKDLGMMLRDREGRYVFCDDARFTPIFDFLAERRVPVVMHIGDPIEAWLPLDPGSPHFGYYSHHPEFHWHGQTDKPGLDEILAHRDRLIERYPETIFVCAHLASLAHDVDRVALLLDRFPNAMVDTASRAADLMRQPAGKVRGFFMKYRDRVLFGSDWEMDTDAFGEAGETREARVAAHIRQLSEPCRYFEQTLALPEEVLTPFYCGNAARVFGWKMP